MLAEAAILGGRPSNNPSRNHSALTSLRMPSQFSAISEGDTEELSDGRASVEEQMRQVARASAQQAAASSQEPRSPTAQKSGGEFSGRGWAAAIAAALPLRWTQDTSRQVRGRVACCMNSVAGNKVVAWVLSG